MNIRAVFFDMGGTLERFWHNPEHRLRETAGLRTLLQSAGIDLGLSDEKLYAVVIAGYERYHSWSIKTMEELSPKSVWADFIFARYPIDSQRLAAVAEDLMFYLESRFFQRELRPEVPAVLEAVRKLGLRIGLISNICCRDLVPVNLEHYGIRDYFDPIVLSSVYGRRKPDPAIFHYAARLADVPTSECIYVGDRIARDIVGARKAGFQLAIQIRHDFDHHEEDTGAKPDAVISSMTELLVILKANLGRTKPESPTGCQVRAILFDAGDILYFRPERDQKFQAFLVELGLADKEIPVTERSALKAQAYVGSISQNEFREATLRLYGVNIPEQLASGKQAMEEDDNNIQFFDGVRETLIELKKEGYLLGIITDTAVPLHVKLRWFEGGGFGNVWDAIISSHDLGIQKPAPEIYQSALRQLGLSANQAIFVGHDPRELDGARAVGMKTVAFNYGQNASADYYIENFADLSTLPVLSS